MGDQGTAGEDKVGECNSEVEGEATSSIEGEVGFPEAGTFSGRDFLGVVLSLASTTPLFRDGPATSKKLAVRFKSTSKMLERLEVERVGEAFMVEAEVDTEVDVELMMRSRSKADGKSENRKINDAQNSQ